MNMNFKAVLTALLLLGTVAPMPAQVWSTNWRNSRYQRRQNPPPPTPTPVPVPTPVPLPPPVVVPPTPITGTLSAADQIANDMLGHSEGQPAGWPYGTDPVINQGNNPAGNGAAVQWGVIYVSASGSSATNARVNIRSCEIYWLQRSTGTWHLGTKSSTPLIEMYAGNYSWGPTGSDSRKEADGTVSVTPVFGDVAHFYPDRFSILANDLAGWAGVCQMRLIVADPSRPDDRASAHYLASTGADYYPAVSGPGIANNPGIAAGRQKFVTNAWRSFAFTTVSQSQLENNPPPISLTGILP